MKLPIDLINKNHLIVIRDLIQKRTGLFFSEVKFENIRKLIVEDFQKSALLTTAEYLKYLHSKKGEEILKRVVDILTPNETFFFREKFQFDILKTDLLPDLISRKMHKTKTLSIWSAGCSTGEETYSLSILLRDLLPDIDKWTIRLIGTDIDENALEKAGIGEYGKWSFRGVENCIIRRCFDEVNDSTWAIKDKYKSLAIFRENNIIADPAPIPGTYGNKFDLILCRNVTIYFKSEAIRQVTDKFHNALNPGGYLIVGHAEHSTENFADFDTRFFPNAIAYQKKNDHKPTHKKSASYQIVENGKKRDGLNRKKSGNKMSAFVEEKKPSRKLAPQKLGKVEKRKKATEETKMFGDALRYFRGKNYLFAKDKFLKILETNPQNARACQMIAHIAANCGDFNDAIKWGERCLEINPLFKESYYTLSLSLLALNRLKEAEAKIKNAIYIDPSYSLAHITLGNIYLELHLDLQAEKSFKMARKLLLSEPELEIVSQTENLTVRDLLNLMEPKIRKK